MIAPRRPLKPRLVRLRSRMLPAARGLRRRSPGSGAGWLPVGLRWRRMARPVSGATAALPQRGAPHSARDGRISFRTRTTLLAQARDAVARGLPGRRGSRGSAGLALRGEPGGRGSVFDRGGAELQPPSRSYRRAAQSAVPARRPLAAASAAVQRLAPAAAARPDWMRRAPGAASTPAQARAPRSPGLRWHARAELPGPGLRQVAAAAPRGPAVVQPATAGLPRPPLQRASRAAAPTHWRLRTHATAVPAHAAAVQVRTGAVSAPALARRTDLVWRAAPTAARSGAAAPSLPDALAAQRRFAPGGYADVPGSATPAPAPFFPAAPPAVPAMLDAAATERLVEDVLRRAEQRLRIERERRGL